MSVGSSAQSCKDLTAGTAMLDHVPHEVPTTWAEALPPLSLLGSTGHIFEVTDLFLTW